MNLRAHLVLLVVVALVTGLVLAVVLGSAYRHDAARLDEARRDRVRRAADVARLLVGQRVAAALTAVRAIAGSAALRDALAEGNRGAVNGVLHSLAVVPGMHVVVEDERGLAVGWSSTMAMLQLGRGEDDAPFRLDVLAGDLAARFVLPIEDGGRRVGTVRGAVLLGRVLVAELARQLELPVAFLVEDEAVHSTFPAPPPPPPGEGEVAGEPYRAMIAGEAWDLAARPLVGEVTPRGLVVVGLSRADLEAARARYLRVMLALGVGGFLVVLLAVGGVLAAERRTAGLSDRLAHLQAVVHDIKAPVGGIQLRAEGLLEDEDRPDVRVALAGIVEACERLGLYLVNVLTAAQAEEGPIRPRDDVVLLPGLLEEVAERTRPLAEARGVRLATDFPADLPPLSGDPVLLERALWNLAANALAVTPAGGEVILFARPGEGDTIELGARDTGPGFRDVDPDRAFERARPRVKDASLRAGSTGLGLFIVSRIAEAHGGRAVARNRDGGGAEVFLALPIRGR